MKRRLLWKLLGVNILSIAFVIVIVWLAVDYLAAGYFVTLMEKYHISPTSSHEMFVDAVHRYLIWASMGALLLAAILGFLFMRRVLGPLVQMTRVTQKISQGDYSDHVPVRTHDEIGHLAQAFNRMAENLHLIEQLRKTMLVDVAHELRTPLTNIQGYIEAVLDGVVTPSEETLRLLLSETMRLVRLVEDVLRLAKADAAKTSLEKTEIDLNDAVAHILGAFRPQMEAKRVRVDTQFGDGLDRVSADPHKISQVITNLLDNAVQYTPADGLVIVSTHCLSGSAKVSIANTAGDMADEDLPFIFERFYRGEKSRSREHGGSGIGLAIVKELVEAHGGQVGAQLSNGQILVWFSLPL